MYKNNKVIIKYTRLKSLSKILFFSALLFSQLSLANHVCDGGAAYAIELNKSLSRVEATNFLMDEVLNKQATTTEKSNSILALCLLSKKSDQSVLDVLENVLLTNEFSLLASSLLAIGHLGDERQFVVVSELLTVKDPRIQSAALATLEKLGCEDCLKSITATAIKSDITEEVQIQAISALARQNYQAAAGQLQDILIDAQGRLALETSIALATMGYSDGMHRLVEKALDPQVKEYKKTDVMKAIESYTGATFGYSKPFFQKRSADDKKKALQKLEIWWQDNASKYTDSNNTKTIKERR